jgi:urea transport system ATP-binding protein
LEIGMVILQDPSLLLVDEPVAGMSDKETEQTGRLLQALSEKQAIVVIEHDMDFVRQIARIVTVLAEGTVICEGTVEHVQADDQVREIYLGRAKVAH